jgi:Na+-transporting methylmalonyl-CoA/oxaloacetate decarboxylase gamma subunit
MTALTILFAGLALAAALAVLALLVVVIVGIHAAERHQSLPHAPRTRSEAIARRVLSVPAPQARRAHRSHAETRR